MDGLRSLWGVGYLVCLRRPTFWLRPWPPVTSLSTSPSGKTSPPSCSGTNQHHQKKLRSEISLSADFHRNTARVSRQIRALHVSTSASTVSSDLLARPGFRCRHSDLAIAKNSKPEGKAPRSTSAEPAAQQPQLYSLSAVHTASWASHRVLLKAARRPRAMPVRPKSPHRKLLPRMQ